MLPPRQQWNEKLKILKDKHCQRPSSQQSYAGMKDKYFPIKQKLKEFNIRPALQET